MSMQHIQGFGFYPTGTFESGLTGIKVFKENIIIKLEKGKRHYRIEENSPIERDHAIGIFLTCPPDIGIAVDRAIDESSKLVNRAAFNEMKLTVRVGTEEVLMGIPLTEIEQSNKWGNYYKLDIGGKIHLSKSSIYVADPDKIEDGEVLEFRIAFLKLDRK